jgi:hypothetical protein
MLALSGSASAVPKIVLISIDGATPRFVDQYLADGTIPANEGLGILVNKGLKAQQVITASPSLTAVGHLSIATGSTSVKTDIAANTFHLLASPFPNTVSGFAAPIGGYNPVGPAPASAPTAIPLWIPLLEAGRTVVAATFPGADGAAIQAPGTSIVVQPAAFRTVSYTVPFGAFGGQGARGYALTSAQFAAAPEATISGLAAAGKASYSPILQATLETISVNSLSFTLLTAALDTTNDSTTNYDTLVFFDQTNGISAGPFTLPATGPAYVRASEQRSARFFFQGTTNQVGTAFYVSELAADLTTVRIARYSANYIPPNTVGADVTDINQNVGFWAPQPDFRIPERLSPGFETFPEAELEAIYEDQVETSLEYQSSVALRALRQNPNADLLMTYFEQPDGSYHQFLLTDPRQPTNIGDPESIGAGQDASKAARYQSYLRRSYQAVNNAVDRLVDEIGIDAEGRPQSNVFVVSDHGFEPFHSAVSVANLVAASSEPDLKDNSKVRFITNGPALNVYINLAGRNNGGTVTPAEFAVIQPKIRALLESIADNNENYRNGGSATPLFHRVYLRPIPADVNDPSFGYGVSDQIGQDFGDVHALLTPGYNFDGTQTPVVLRKGDGASTTPVLSVPNFYGAHGYDPTLPNMSAILYAAGPDIGKKTLELARSIDIAPTLLQILGVTPALTVEGQALDVGPEAGSGGEGGQGGEGGSAAGQAGESSGTSGEGGQGGEGGEGGQGGEGGETGEGGEGATAGEPANGGTAGSNRGGSSAMGGRAGSSGAGGKAGSSSPGGAANAGRGGTAGRGGNAGRAGSAGAGPVDPGEDDDGCNCEVAGANTGSASGWSLVALLALGLVTRRSALRLR